MSPLRAARIPLSSGPSGVITFVLDVFVAQKFDIDQRQHATQSAQSALGTNGQNPLQGGCSEGFHGIATQDW